MERKKFYLSILIVFILLLTIGCYFKYYESVNFTARNKIVKVSDMNELTNEKKKVAIIYLGNDRNKTALEIKNILRETVKKYNVDLYYIDTDVVKSQKGSIIEFNKNDPPKLVSIRGNKINGEIQFTGNIPKDMIEKIVDFRVSDVVDKTYNIRSFNLLKHITVLGLLILFIENLIISNKTTFKVIFLNMILNCIFMVALLYMVTCKGNYINIMNMTLNVMSFETLLGFVLIIANTVISIKSVNKYNIHKM